MSENSVARPYARALFEYALQQQALASWAEWLECLAALSRDESLVALRKNPSLSAEQLAALVVSIAKELTTTTWLPELEPFIRLLISNKRLVALPAIATLYARLREAQERTLCVDVTSFSLLTETQATRLTERLSRRFARQVVLHQHLDSSLLGGVLIRAHDVVIDGSIKGQLIKLRADLAMSS